MRVCVASLTLYLFSCAAAAGLLSCTLPLSNLPPELAQCQTRSHRFRYDTNGTVVDTCTQLTWMVQDFRNLEGRAPEDWYEAIHWADKMNAQRYGGYDDWRAPMGVEYQTISGSQHRTTAYAGQSVDYAAAFAAGGGKQFWTPELYHLYLKDRRAIIDMRWAEAVVFDFTRGGVSRVNC